ncbi:MAG: hypothetical protein H7Z42_07005 [Roseiflexaceae bacterium]|nr:hypothetical protein [Roseiflexaceae bacterium]
MPTIPALSNAALWQAQQDDRQEFEVAREYRATAPAMLLWFDPLTSQHLEVGKIIGQFSAIATFTIRREDVAALAVPYTIDTDYGLTAISPAVKERMRAAGYTERVEAFVLVDESIIFADAAGLLQHDRSSSSSASAT